MLDYWSKNVLSELNLFDCQVGCNHYFHQIKTRENDCKESCEWKSKNLSKHSVLQHGVISQIEWLLQQYDFEQRGHRGHDILAVTDKSERHENYFSLEDHFHRVSSSSTSSATFFLPHVVWRFFLRLDPLKLSLLT